MRNKNGPLDRFPQLVKVLRVLVPALSLLWVDQGLKRWVVDNFPLLKRTEVLGQSHLVIARVHNRGLAGDRFSHIPNGYIEPYTQYFPAACLAALFAVAVWRWPMAGRGERSFTAMMLAGGFSNLWDHIRNGYVVDPLQIRFLTETYLPFNLADVGIVLGAMVLGGCLLSELVNESRGR